MKKMVAVIVLLVIALLCFYAVAEETREITFQNVPWFSSPDEVTKLLGESGFTNGKSFKVSKTFSDSNIAKYNKDKKVPYIFSKSKKDSRITAKLHRQWQNNVEKTIAKHRVSFLYAYYTAEPNNPQLVEFKMSLKNPDGKYNQKAIYNALVETFGKPKASRNGKEFVWLGDNNTIAILNQNHVVFATLDGLEYAETIELDIEEPEDTGF